MIVCDVRVRNCAMRNIKVRVRIELSQHKFATWDSEREKMAEQQVSIQVASSNRRIVSRSVVIQLVCGFLHCVK